MVDFSISSWELFLLAYRLGQAPNQVRKSSWRGKVRCWDWSIS